MFLIVLHQPVTVFSLIFGSVNLLMLLARLVWFGLVWFGGNYGGEVGGRAVRKESLVPEADAPVSVTQNPLRSSELLLLSLSYVLAQDLDPD